MKMRPRTRNQWDELYKNWYYKNKKKRSREDDDIEVNENVVASDDVVEAFLGEEGCQRESSNGSTLKSRPESRVGLGSKVCYLEEFVSCLREDNRGKNNGGQGIDTGSFSESPDMSLDSCCSEDESTSEEDDDEFSDEDYKVDELSASESSDSLYYDPEVKREKDGGYDASEEENTIDYRTTHLMRVNESNEEDHDTRFKISSREKQQEDEIIISDKENSTSIIEEGYHATHNEESKLAGLTRIHGPYSKFGSKDKARKDGNSGGSSTACNESKEVNEKLKNHLKKRKAFELEILSDSGKINGKEDTSLPKYLQPKTVSKSQKMEAKHGKFSEESNIPRDEYISYIERFLGKGRQCSEKIVKLSKSKTSAARNVELTNILMESINLLKEQKFPMEENVFTQKSFPLKFRFEDEVQPPIEKSQWEKEMDSMFHDLELGLRESEIDCNSSMMENDDLTETDTSPAACCGRGEHQPILDDQIGIVCEYCAAAILDIKYVLPPFYIPPLSRRDRKDSDDSPTSNISQIHFHDSARGTPDFISPARGTVWDLVPGVEKEMYPHQREGFEFMWRNIAGDIVIQKLSQSLCDRGSGCIISHAPGTGKTRLTIVFLAAFLKQYPTCRPVIIAPRGMLLTWESEFIKWNVNIPFHNMNNGELSDNEVAFAAKIIGQVGSGGISRDHIRWLKLCTWMQGRSILGISYHLFEKLAGENQKGEENKKMRELLLEYTGLLVLDEGHTPRNDQSLIWKALTKVSTRRCIILSGTPFQNNLAELYNTLCLVNPHIVNQTGSEYNRIYKTRGPRNSLARKRWTSLANCIGKNTDDALKKLKVMLDPFVHVHKGTILEESLPGLRDTLVFLHPTELQKTLLETSTNTRHIFHRIRLVSMVSVHPSLLPEKRRSNAHKSKLEEIESDVEAGVKTQFVMNLIWLADALGERVLIFSQFIDPLMFIKKRIKSHLSWNEGRELLYMDGKLDERQRQDSISSFNDDKSEAKVLLASERACSEGINLVGASRVVLLDTVWNPSVEKQAISRAYRLGQRKVVYVYRLFTSGTEVRQYAQQIHKERISQLIFTSVDGQTCQSDKSNTIPEDDKVLEAMLGCEKLSHIFEKIIRQPKESDLVEIFGLMDLK